MRKKKPTGSPAMAAKGRKPVQVWLEEELHEKFATLAKEQGRTTAKLLRVLIRYAVVGGATALSILDGVARDKLGPR